MPQIDLSILNQRQTPAFYADVLANRPAAGFIGRIFVSTDTFAFFRDNGTGWDLIGGPGTGTVTGSGTTGQVTFWDGASTITGDSGLTYNGTTNALTSLGTIKATNYYVGNPTDLTRSFSASGDANSVALWLEEYGNTSSAADIFLNKGRGTESSKANVQIGDSLGGAAFSGYVNGSLNPSLAWGSEVVNINTTNNFADADFSVGQTYNGTAFNTNLRIRAIDGFVVAPNGGFETTGNINLFAGANTRRIVFDANNGIARIFSFRTGNLPRWAFRVDGTETGSSTGADLAIRRYDDTGAFVDAPLSINRASGQSTFVKKVIINNNTGDDQLQIVSTSAPSLRFDNLQTGATKRAGLGISTATNNFIQGSADRDFCIFNGSTTASPILFGVYDAGAGNVQEAARISAARNFLIGQVVDNGEKLQIGGNIYITSAGSTAGQRITLQNTTVNEIQYAFVNGGSSINNVGRLAVRNGANGTNLLQIDSAGTAFLQEINAGVSAALNTIAAVNGSGGGNRQFDLSFSGTTTGFVGQDNGDQGYGYFQVVIESGKVYQIQTTIATVNGSPITVITSSSTNFATGTVQTVEASPIDGTSYYQFTASGAAAYIGIGFSRTSGTMTATVTNFSIKELNNVLFTQSGTVGINTRNPRGIFDVRTAIDRGVTFTGTVSNESVISGMQGDVTNNLRNLRISARELFFNAGDGTNSTGTQAMQLSTSANLLIGTSTDNGNKLQVNGNQSINGNLRLLDFITPTANYWDCYQYNDNTLRYNYNGSGGDEFILYSNGDLQIANGGIKTASPSGGSAQFWKLGDYTAGVAVQAGKVRVEINGVAYDLLTA
jgi:hypothetical protein